MVLIIIDDRTRGSGAVSWVPKGHRPRRNIELASYAHGECSFERRGAAGHALDIDCFWRSQ